MGPTANGIAPPGAWKNERKNGSHPSTGHAGAGHVGVENGAPSPLESAILEAVAYADIFDYPLTAAEIHRYLPAIAATAGEVEAALGGEQLSHRLHRHAVYYLLPGRAEIVEARRRRTELAARLWPLARRYARAIAVVPFVRMVAVTGSLAMSNVDDGGDIDYLIVTEPGRLWLCRALIILIVRAAARHGDTICPNFLLSERALLFADHTLYTARELAQMQPLSGANVYRRIRTENSWVDRFLPNADGPPPDSAYDEPRLPLWRGPVEAILRTPIGGLLERWEMRRKIRRLSNRPHPPVGEVEFTADRCRGHFEGHRSRTLRAYSNRIDSLTGHPARDGVSADRLPQP